MEIELEPSSERFDPNDDRWLAQVAQLMADLRRDVGDVSRQGEARPGMKGVDLGPIIVALGSAGAFTAFTEVIKAFVGRDRGRSVKLSWHLDGKLESFEIQGPDIDDDVLDEALAALEQTAERPQ